MKMDFLKILETQMNNTLKKSELAPAIKVLNKYGIHGSKALQFLNEFCAAANEINLNKKGDE